jgi:acyl carrier protein
MNRDEIAAEVRRLVHEQQQTTLGGIRTPVDQITDGAAFSDDLGFDSLDNIEFILAIERRFNIEVWDDDAENILTVGGVVSYLANRLAVVAA